MNIGFRPIEKEDVELRYKWLNDPEVNKFLGATVRQGTTLEVHQKWFDDYVKNEEKKIFTILADGKPIGNVGLTDINKLDGNASLYVMIGEKDLWGNGIGKKAVNFIIDYGFTELNLHKIYLDVHADNMPAIKIYQSFNFTQEGIFKEHINKDGQYLDEIRMRLIKDRT